jgi:hypothetical protein
MLLLSAIEVKLETIEFMDGKRVATQQDVDRRYDEWESNMGDELLWFRYFAAYNSRQAYIEESGT